MEPPNEPGKIWSELLCEFRPSKRSQTRHINSNHKVSQHRSFPAMIVSLSNRGQGTFVLRGRLDVMSISDILFAGQKQFEKCENITVDLGEAECASTAGLALLLEWSTWSEEHGKKLAYKNATRNLLDLIDLNGVDRLLHVLPR